MQTQRLILAPFDTDDEQLLYGIFTDPFIRKYLWDDIVISKTQNRELWEQNIRFFEEENWGLWKIQIKNTKEIIGFTGLWPFFEEPQPQLLYGILEAYTGHGYASEAARKILDYTFAELAFDYLLAAMDEPHQASQKLAERIGMKFLEKKIEEGKSTVFYKIEKS